MFANRLYMHGRVTCILAILLDSGLHSRIIAAEPFVGLERSTLVDTYIRNQGTDRDIAIHLGPSVIVDIVRSLRGEVRSETNERLVGRVWQENGGLLALMEALRLFQGYEETAVGKAAVYEQLNANRSALKNIALHGVVELDGEKATDALLAKLLDPDQYIRVIAAELLGDKGRTDAGPQIEAIMERRKRGMKKDEIELDASFRFMRAAIAELRDRANGHKEGLDVSKRVDQETLRAFWEREVRAGRATPPPATPRPLPVSAPPKTDPFPQRVPQDDLLPVPAASPSPKDQVSPDTGMRSTVPASDRSDLEVYLVSTAAVLVATASLLWMVARRRANRG